LLCYCYPIWAVFHDC